MQLLFSNSLLVLHFLPRPLYSLDAAAQKTVDYKWKYPAYLFLKLLHAKCCDEYLKGKILPLDGAIVMLFNLLSVIMWMA